MGRGPSKKGEEARRRILAELARRYSEFEPPPTWGELCAALAMSNGSLELHLRGLRSAGLVHERALWITRAGLLSIGPSLGLTL
jgi:DNA-binding transcriptional ArsR family regulator